MVHKAVYWAKTGQNSHGGITISGTPVEINCRWLWTKKNVQDPNGSVVVVEATVTLETPIVPDSILWLGTLADWMGTGSTSADTRLMQAWRYREVEDIRGIEVRRSAMLIHYGTDLPPES